MIVKEMNIAFMKLKKKYHSGHLKEDDLVLAIDKLRLVSSSGTQWRIKPNGRGWTYWDSDHWQVGQPSKDPTLKPVFEDWQDLIPLKSNPSTLKYLFKFFKKISIQMVKQLPKKILMTVLTVFVLNAIINNLYEATDSAILERLAVMMYSKKPLLTRFVYYFVWTIIVASAMKNKSNLVPIIKTGLNDLKVVAKKVFGNFKTNGLSFITGLSIALALSSLLQGRVVSFLLMTIFIMALLNQENSQLIYFISLVRKDFSKLANITYKPESLKALMIGLIDGSFLAFILDDSLTPYGWFLSIIVLVVFIIRNNMEGASHEN